MKVIGKITKKADGALLHIQMVISIKDIGKRIKRTGGAHLFI